MINKKFVILILMVISVVALLVVVQVSKQRQDQYNNWLTYRNDNFGYQFLYPSDWTIHDGDYPNLGKGDPVGFINPKIQVGIIAADSDITTTPTATNGLNMEVIPNAPLVLIPEYKDCTQLVGNVSYLDKTAHNGFSVTKAEDDFGYTYYCYAAPDLPYVVVLQFYNKNYYTKNNLNNYNPDDENQLNLIANSFTKISRSNSDKQFEIVSVDCLVSATNNKCKTDYPISGYTIVDEIEAIKVGGKYHIDIYEVDGTKRTRVLNQDLPDNYGMETILALSDGISILSKSDKSVLKAGTFVHDDSGYQIVWNSE